MTDEWFRNTSWDGAVAHRFEQKLRRARNKAQYLRIQASLLTKLHPEVALTLLERYFALGDEFDHAQAFVDRANALAALRRPEDAVAAYEKALAREQEFPNVRTNACLELPMLVARAEMKEHYDRALELLMSHRDHPAFPVQRFQWHAARALIFASRQNLDDARREAVRALDAAALKSSDLRYHRSLGLVGSGYDDLVVEVARIAQASQ